jgi:hypothetical protein
MEDEAIQNKSLYQVDGRERVLFDDKLTMELPNYEGKSSSPQCSQTDQEGEKPINHIRPFSINVPLTNVSPPQTIHLTLVPTTYEGIRRIQRFIRET